MRSFYKASAKVPESPYPPALASAPSATRRRQANVTHVVPSNWNKPELSLPRSEGSTPSLQEHLRTSCRRHIALDGPHTEARAERFPHEDEQYGKDFRSRIGQSTMKQLSPWYEKAEAELGVVRRRGGA